MQSLYTSLIKPLLFKLDPEHAHELTIEAGLLAVNSPIKNVIFSPFKLKQLEQKEFKWKGISFKNRIGLAAGFDKNARLMPLMNQLGFGFLEIGSVTAKSSKGNSKPRLFRIPKDAGIINRMGLNNDGVDEIIHRLSSYQSTNPIGINIAKTHSPLILGDLAIQDYVYSFIKSEPIADYLTINISCPNTEEGKTFEDPETLRTLLSQLSLVRKTAKPILVKLSVDLDIKLLEELVSLCKEYGIDGFICSNTSSSRKNLQTDEYDLSMIGKGGLSGSPIFKKSVKNVSIVKAMSPNELVIGVGGIDSKETGKAYFEAGADLIQVYTGLIYKGPSLIKELNFMTSQFFS